MSVTLIIIASGGILLLMLIMMAVVKACYKAVHPGQALVINKVQGTRVVLAGGALVIPVVHRGEWMDITARAIIIERRGKDGLIRQDNIRADVRAEFIVRVNRTEEDVLAVAHSIGTARASDPSTLQELFAAKFSEALKTVAKQFDFEDLLCQREDFRDQVLRVVGQDLNGFRLDDLVIDYIEQTPIDALDPHNVLDAEGIRKIRERTGAENARSDQLLAEERRDAQKGKLLEVASSEPAPPIFGRPVDVEMSDLIPDDSRMNVTLDAPTSLRIEEPKGWTVRIEHNEALLSVEENEGPVHTVRLDQSFQVKLSRDEDMRLGLALRQAQPGTDIRLRFILNGKPLQMPTDNQASRVISRLRRQNLEGLVLDEHGPHLLLVLRRYYEANGGELDDWV